MKRIVVFSATLLLLLVSVTCFFSCAPADGSAGLEFKEVWNVEENQECYVVSGLGSCEDAEIVIPSTHRGKKVIGIKSEAFAYKRQIVSVVLSDDISYIGEMAFYECSGLVNVTVGSGLREIGGAAFGLCTSLENVYLKDFSQWFEIEFDDLSNPLIYADHMYVNGSLFGEEIVIPEEVRAIPTYAFQGFSGIKALVVPEGVDRIGGAAFATCSNLESVTILNPDIEIGEKVFEKDEAIRKACISSSALAYLTAENLETVEFVGNTAGGMRDCVRLKEVTIPEGVTSIGGNAFSGCTGLTDITIPESVTSIGSGAFEGCTGLASVTFSDCVTNIGDSAFSGCTGLTSATISEGVTSIGDYAFHGCTGLASVTISEGVTSIGASAFSGCTGLASVTISEGVTSIGESAFVYCKSLTSITVPEGVTSIGDFAFRSCTSLTAITLPASLTSIGEDAFGNPFSGSGAEGLTGVYINDLAAWCRIAFENKYANPLFYAGILYIDNIPLVQAEIPEGVTSIHEYAFYCCTSLESVTLPESVTSIGQFAFNHCTSLASITIPEGVTSIGGYAFNCCPSLISITIPASMTRIGLCAFWECTGLTSVIFVQPNGWGRHRLGEPAGLVIDSHYLSHPKTAAVCLLEEDYDCWWSRNDET